MAVVCYDCITYAGRFRGFGYISDCVSAAMVLTPRRTHAFMPVTAEVLFRNGHA